MVSMIRMFFTRNLKSTESLTRIVDDFQPRKNANNFFEQENLSTEDEFEHFCNTFACEMELAKKYVEHLQILEINKKNRAEVRKIQLKDQEEKKTFEDYDGKRLFEDGALN
jgi:hypothetical protein